MACHRSSDMTQCFNASNEVKLRNVDDLEGFEAKPWPARCVNLHCQIHLYILEVLNIFVVRVK